MKELSQDALRAISLIEEEYGVDVKDEILQFKIEKKRINCDVVNEYHIQLLSKSYWRFEEIEHGAVAMEQKRPYGNSDVIDDIREITKLYNSETTLENLHRGLVGVIKLWIDRGMPALETLLGEKIDYSECKIKRG